MLQYKEPLSKRNKAETGIRYEWYALQRWGAKYWEDFSKPKIIYPDICANLSFCVDRFGFYLSNTAYFITSNDESILEYLVDILNHKAIDWYYRTLSVQLGEKAVRMFSIYVLHIPIPPISDEALEDILQLTKAEKEFIHDSSI